MSALLLLVRFGHSAKTVGGLNPGYMTAVFVASRTTSAARVFLKTLWTTALVALCTTGFAGARPLRLSERSTVTNKFFKLQSTRAPASSHSSNMACRYGMTGVQCRQKLPGGVATASLTATSRSLARPSVTEPCVVVHRCGPDVLGGQPFWLTKKAE